VGPGGAPAVAHLTRGIVLTPDLLLLRLGIPESGRDVRATCERDALSSIADASPSAAAVTVTGQQGTRVIDMRDGRW
jgi:hypothetical protein